MNDTQKTQDANHARANACGLDGSSVSRAADVAAADASKYVPIGCDFHDLLEVHAMARKPAQIRFRDDADVVQLRSAVITDVFARDGADYLTLSTGETLRLDRLIAVDDAMLGDD